MPARTGKMLDETEAKPEEVETTEEAKVEEEEAETEPTEKSIDDLEDSEELWDGGPTAGQIKEWKDQYGDVYVTEVTRMNYVVWRTISRFEYRNLVKNMEQALSTGQVTQAQANMDNEEAICELCVLYPRYRRQEAAGNLAGIPSTIPQQVMEASGFAALEVRQL